MQVSWRMVPIHALIVSADGMIVIEVALCVGIVGLTEEVVVTAELTEGVVGTAELTEGVVGTAGLTEGVVGIAGLTEGVVGTAGSALFTA